MKDHVKIPVHPCPKCGYKPDCVSQAFLPGARMPVEGDLTMCLNCGGFFYFKKDLKLRFPTKKEKLWLAMQDWATDMKIAQASVVAGKDLAKQQSESGSGTPQ